MKNENIGSNIPGVIKPGRSCEVAGEEKMKISLFHAAPTTKLVNMFGVFPRSSTCWHGLPKQSPSKGLDSCNNPFVLPNIF
jgi:hypothetical protein